MLLFNLIALSNLSVMQIYLITETRIRLQTCFLSSKLLFDLVSNIETNLF
jgi:hypothetical protein